MKKNLILYLGAMLMLVFCMSSCSNSDDEKDNNMVVLEFISELMCTKLRSASSISLERKCPHVACITIIRIHTLMARRPFPK